MATTTIRMSRATRASLARLKPGPRETFDGVLNKLLTLVPEGDEEGRYTRAFRAGLLEALVDVRKGWLTDHETVKKWLRLLTTA